MMRRTSDETGSAQAGYREESARPALLVLLAAAVLVSAPFGWAVRKLNGEAIRLDTDIAKYGELARKVGRDVDALRKLLANEVVDEELLPNVVAAPVVILITPDVPPTNLAEAVAQDPGRLDIRLRAIYWNSHDPLVTIDDETYRTGDMVKGFKIVEIRATEVVFLSPLGDKVVVYFYDYLDPSKPKKK